MRWKRILIIAAAAAALALSLYAISLAHAGIHTMQTIEADRAERGQVLRFGTVAIRMSNPA
jgi:hypothetical protein